MPAKSDIFPTAPSATTGFVSALAREAPPVTILAEIGKEIHTMKPLTQSSLEDSGRMGALENVLLTGLKSKNESVRENARYVDDLLAKKIKEGHSFGKKDMVEVLAKVGGLENVKVDAVTMSAAERVLDANGLGRRADLVEDHRFADLQYGLAKYATAVSETHGTFRPYNSAEANVAPTLAIPAILLLDSQQSPAFNNKFAGPSLLK